MTTVSDTSANADEKIERAARVIRASKQCKEAYMAIYKGKKAWKTVEDIRASVSNFNGNTYTAAAKLFSEDIVNKKVIKGVIYYGKKDFYAHNRPRILSLSENAPRLRTYPTKRKSSSQTVVKNYVFRTKPQVEMLTVDDIDSFVKVKAITSADSTDLKNVPERKINKAICIIMNQSEKKDWGGERNDIYTNNLIFKGKRTPSAFALKGKATKDILSPNKMGKKADQVQRLFEGTAAIHFVVHHSDIDERVLDQMQAQAINKSVSTGKKIYYCPIDGKDLARLRDAYPLAFS